MKTILSAALAGRKRFRRGITLVEMMISVAIMSIGMLGMIGSFKYLNVGIQTAKQKSLANNIAQEKMAYIKNKSYYRVMVTTRTPDLPDANFTPAMVYDLAPNGVENITVGGISFERRILITKVSEDPTTGDLVEHSWSSPDTGLKQVTVSVVWQERGDWKKLELRNLVDNPERTNLSATFSGKVYEGATMANIEGATVRAQENPSKYGETDVSGDYLFVIEPGSYTLMASKDGYFPLTRANTGIESSETMEDQDFALTKMSSGTVRSSYGAFIRDHLVISMIVASTIMVNGVDIEFVELYNPTTWPINISDGGSGNDIRLRYYGESGASQDVDEFQLSYISTFVGPGRYYLIANSFPLTVGGGSPVTDALYAAQNGTAFGGKCTWDAVTGMDCIRTLKAGAIEISHPAGGVIDRIGWSHNSAAKTPTVYEGSYFSNWLGFPGNSQIMRNTGYGWLGSNTGRAWDTNNNSSDGMWLTMNYQPYGTLSGAKTSSLTGTPAAGAMVFADDTLSAPVTVGTTGWFVLPSVSTGSWTVYVTSGSLFTSTGTFRVASDGVNVLLPSSNIILGTATLYGFVTGTVTGMEGAALPGIKIYSAGTPQVTTRSDGRYTLPAVAGVTTVIANFQNQEPSYLELSSMNVTVALGGVTPGIDFALSFGGKIRGLITTNGVDPLPGVPVVALKDGVEQGNGISGDDGYFTVSGSGISTGTYVVEPQLESSETCLPSSTTVVLDTGEVAWSSTYTVSGAYGYITGKATTGSPTGPAITTGVLIYASTTPIAGDPPAINSALRGATQPYYAASTDATGIYTISVKGGYTYNLYAWYTTWNGVVPTVTRKKYEAADAFSVDPNGTVTKDFFW